MHLLGIVTDRVVAAAARGTAEVTTLGHAGRIDIELLVVPACPHESPARDLALRMLAELGLTAELTATVIATEAEARARGFVGSPTFLIDGEDPFAEPGAAVGVACRVYRTGAGWAGLPSETDLRAALRSRGDHP